MYIVSTLLWFAYLLHCCEELSPAFSDKLVDFTVRFSHQLHNIMVSTRKRNLDEQTVVEAGTPAHKGSAKQQQESTAKKSRPATHKKQKQAEPAVPERLQSGDEQMTIGPAEPSSQIQAQKAATAVLHPAADLLPLDLIQQLSQSRKYKQQSSSSSLQRPKQQVQQQRQQQQQQQQTKKQKQRLVQVQKGPVKVAVLPAVAAAAEAGTALSAGAAVRQQLLESRIQRSKVMLQPAGLRSW